MAGTAAVAGILLAFSVTVISAGGVADLIQGLKPLRKVTHRSEREWRYLRRAHAFETADIARDVEHALVKNDRRLKAIRAIDLPIPEAPGVDLRQAFGWPHGLDFIASTSDAPTGAEQLVLERAAREYAKRYNLVLLSRLSTK